MSLEIFYISCCLNFYLSKATTPLISVGVCADVQDAVVLPTTGLTLPFGGEVSSFFFFLGRPIFLMG